MSTSMILLGADAGGTKTAAAVWRDGELLSRFNGAPGAVRPGRALAAASAIIDACRQALSATRLARGDALVVGAAGVGRPSERDELAQALRSEGLCDRVVVVTDIELVLAAAFDHGPGIALAAGTGSIAVSRSAEGTLLRSGGHGWQFQLALEVLQHLHKVRGSARRGLTATELATAMEVDILQLEPVLQVLVQLDWIGRLNEVDDEENTRFVLLADAQSTTLEPLMRQLLLPSSDATAKLWSSGRLSSVYLHDVLE